MIHLLPGKLATPAFQHCTYIIAPQASTDQVHRLVRQVLRQVHRPVQVSLVRAISLHIKLLLPNTCQHQRKHLWSEGGSMMSSTLDMGGLFEPILVHLGYKGSGEGAWRRHPSVCQIHLPLFGH